MLRGIGLIDRVNGLQQGAPATVKHFSKEGKVKGADVNMLTFVL